MPFMKKKNLLSDVDQNSQGVQAIPYRIEVFGGLRLLKGGVNCLRTAGDRPRSVVANLQLLLLAFLACSLERDINEDPDTIDDEPRGSNGPGIEDVFICQIFWGNDYTDDMFNHQIFLLNTLLKKKLKLSPADVNNKKEPLVLRDQGRVQLNLKLFSSDFNDLMEHGIKPLNRSDGSVMRPMTLLKDVVYRRKGHSPEAIKKRHQLRSDLVGRVARRYQQLGVSFPLQEDPVPSYVPDVSEGELQSFVAPKWWSGHRAITEQLMEKRVRAHIPYSPSEPRQVLRRFFDGDETNGFWPQRVVEVDALGQTSGDPSSLSQSLITSTQGSARNFSQCVLLTGAGGSGKSSNLDKLFFEAANGRLSEDGSSRDQVWVPVLFPLNALHVRNGRLQSIEDALSHEFLPGEIQPSEVWRTLCSQVPNLLVLLDGLNEVSSAVRHHANDLVTNIESMVREFQALGVNFRVIMTCRQQEDAQPQQLIQKLEAGSWSVPFRRFEIQPLNWEEACDKLEIVFGDDALRVIDRLGDAAQATLTNPFLLRIVLSEVVEIKRYIDESLSLTRSHICEIAINKLLDHDSKRQRLAGVLQNAELVRTGLEVLAAAMLDENKQEGSGSTYFPVEAIPDLLEGVVVKNYWNSGNWWQRLQNLNGRSLRFDEVADALLALNVMHVLGDKRVGFLHETFRDYLASGCISSSDEWKDGQIPSTSCLNPEWEEAVIFAVERNRNDSTEPLLRVIEDPSADTYLQRRAVEIWGRLGRLTSFDINRVSAIFFSDERLLRDAASHALREVLLRSTAKSERSRFAHFIDSQLGSNNSQVKLFAIRVVYGLGQAAEPKLRESIVRATNDSNPSVRVEALLTLINNATLQEVMESATLHCFDEDRGVRYAGLELLLAGFHRKRSPEFRKRAYSLLNEFQARFGHNPEDRYLLIRWWGRGTVEDWTTRNLVNEILQPSLIAIEDGDTLQWVAARFLCSSLHRCHISQEEKIQLFKIIEDAKRPAPLRAVLEQLKQLLLIFDEESQWPYTPPEPDYILSLPPLSYSSTKAQGDTNSDLWGKWKTFHLSNKPVASMELCWGDVRVAHRYFSLSFSEAQAFITDLDKVLDSSDQAAWGLAVKLLGCLGLSDENLVRLRLKCLQHKDAHTRHHAATVLLNFCESVGLVAQLEHNFLRDQDHTTRWDAGGSLVHLVGEPILSELIERAERDPSPLTRGFLVERLRFFGYRPQVREALKRIIKNERNATVRARAIRCYELFGTPDELPLLADLSSDETMTRYGCIGALAAEVHEAITQHPSPMTQYSSADS